MQLQISGKPMGNGVSHSLIRSASNFMSDILMAEDLDRLSSLSIEINLLPGYSESYGQIAECNWLDDKFYPTRFYIDLDSGLSHKSTLITLGHELVHIKQMTFGHRQESLDGTVIRWLGVAYKPNAMDYYDLPWEIEAHGREYGLYDRFINHQAGITKPPATIIDESRRLNLVTELSRSLTA
jgi:hypothetical protein